MGGNRVERRANELDGRLSDAQHDSQSRGRWFESSRRHSLSLTCNHDVPCTSTRSITCSVVLRNGLVNAPICTGRLLAVTTSSITLSSRSGGRKLYGRRPPR